MDGQVDLILKYQTGNYPHLMDIISIQFKKTYELPRRQSFKVVQKRSIKMLGFDATKTKVQLKLALNRLNLAQKKKAAINQNMRRDIAMLIKDGKVESARVRVEHIIREDFLIEALELLELYADTLLARFGLVTAMKDMDVGISEPIHALVYAAPRVDIVELVVVRDQLIKKYGKDLVERTNGHALECVNPRVLGY